jgi:hypothetical protein
VPKAAAFRRSGRRDPSPAGGHQVTGRARPRRSRQSRLHSPCGRRFALEDRERTLDSPTDKIMLSLTAFADELERESRNARTTRCSGKARGLHSEKMTFREGTARPGFQVVLEGLSAI